MFHLNFDPRSFYYIIHIGWLVILEWPEPTSWLVSDSGGPLGQETSEIISVCPLCAQAKNSNSPPAGLLHPLSIPRRPWSNSSLDFVTGLPNSTGNTVILTVVDRLSKMVHSVALPKLPLAKETAEALFHKYSDSMGYPVTSSPTEGLNSQPRCGRSSVASWGSQPASLLASTFRPTARHRG